MTSKMTEPYMVRGTLKFQLEKNSSVLKWFQRWQTPTSFVGTFKIILKKTIQYPKGLKDRKALHPLWGHSNPNWKRQFIIEMITKMTEPYILCGTFKFRLKRQLSINRFERSQNFTSFVGKFKSQLKKQDHYRNDYKDDIYDLTFFVRTFNYQLKKTVQYWNDLKYEGTLHLLLGHWNSNWNRQFSIEMITKMTELNILCGDIQIPTEKTAKYRNDFKDHRTLHPLFEHSSSNWKKKQFSIEMISKMTEPCILCGDIHVQIEKSVQHRNDLNYQRTLHPLWGHSNPNWKTQIIIEMIRKMTAPYILCWHVQVSIERSLHLLLGHLKSNWKKQFSIQMISRMTEPYIVCGDTQIPTEKDSSVLKWFQRSQNVTSFESRFRPQLKRTG